MGKGFKEILIKSRHTIRFFNVFDLRNNQYLKFPLFLETIENILKLETVPIIDINWTLPDNIEDLLNIAEGKSVLNKNSEREGLVVRSLDRKISFKAISNKYLLGEK